MTKAEKLCKNVKKDVKAQAVTLADAMLVMQEKIEEQIPIYRQMPLVQQVTLGTGEVVLRDNPLVKEFRATVKDYADTMSKFLTLIDENQKTASSTSLADLKKQFKVVG